MKAVIPFLLNFVFYLFVCVTCLILGGLTLNNLPMGADPGFGARLKRYLTTNIARTEENAKFPELELPVINASPRLLLTRIERAMVTLGWTITDFDEQNQTITAEARSAIFRFVDDVKVELRPYNQQVAIYMESKSRIGRGDLGANTRHILDLLSRIDQQIELETGP